MSHPDQHSVCSVAISSSRKEELLPALGRSTLGRWLDPRELHAAAQRGRHRRLAPGASCDGSDLTVVLDGELTAGAGDDWRGTGCILDMRGFVAGDAKPWIAGSRGATIWAVPRDCLSSPRDPRSARLAAVLLAALLEQMEGAQRSGPAVDLCATAAALAAPTPWQAALRVWAYVRSVPYRFGSWQHTPADTLRAGAGMCTTKAALQVELLRLLGLRAGFAEIAGDAAYVRALMPRAFRRRVRSNVRHLCAAVELDGRWTLMDASFTVPALRLMADSLPAVRPWVHRSPRPAAPHSMAHALSGVDPLGVEVHPGIDHLMTKRSSHRPEVLEAMNLLLDEAQSRRPSRTHVRLRELAARAPFPALGAAWRTCAELAGPTAPTPSSVAA
jgi:hypothetical protein